MKIPFKITIYLIFGIVLNAFSQNNAIKRANGYFEDFAYVKAIKAYETIVKEKDATQEVYKKLGDAYYLTSNLNKAATYYERALAIKDSVPLPAEYYFRAAIAYKYLKRYKKADAAMGKLKELSEEDSRAQRLLEQPDYLELIAKQSGRYTISNLLENSIYTDFAPSFYKTELVLSSSRSKGTFTEQKNMWTEQSYLNLYSSFIDSTASISFPLVFSKKINTRLHESTSSFSTDGKTLYFTRNNLINSEFKKDSVDVNRLKIFKTIQNEKGKWIDIESLPFNNDHYSVAHPSLSPDGTALYFSSDMPGGYGLSDLYVVSIDTSGSFGQPRNLGPKINTEGRDTFPFISKQGHLYFASNGHLGLGGLDIFVADLEKEDYEVYNVGAPINSVADDITFIIDDTTRKGYFASNRRGGKGDDDIYSFIENEKLITKCLGTIKGVVMEEDKKTVMPDAVIIVRNSVGGVLFSQKTDAAGTFSFEVDCNDQMFTIQLNKENYHPLNEEVTVTKANPNVVRELIVKKVPPPIAKGLDLAKLLKLKPIYFASNKAQILDETSQELDKVVSFLREYPEVSIEIGSHTDSRGSDAYNLKLSTKRANATANYIIEKGITSIRVKSKGYGETVLTNACSNGSNCSKAQHQANRRSEFIVIQN